MQALTSFLKRSSHSQSVVGVEALSGGLAIVAQQQSKEGIPELIAASFVVLEQGLTMGAVLQSWVEANGLKGAQCNYVLSRDDYQLLLVEPPDVPEAELRNAIRWRLKDLVNIPIEKAAVDVFPLPEDGTKANKKMVYVVASDKQKIQDIIAAVEGSGLKLNAIDIGELSIRNIATRLICDEESERGVAITRLGRGNGNVYIFRKNNMYLARSFSLDYNAGLLDELPQEALALEIQRSLDYYERQMGQVPPSVVYLCGDNVSEDKIGPTLKASLANQLQLLDPSAVLAASEGVDELGLCMGALGAALRQVGA